MTGLDTLLVLTGAGTITAALMRLIAWLDEGGYHGRQKTAR